MKDTVPDNEPWQHDGLGYAAIGQAFTNIVKSIDDSKVISIEAGFGHGKTFFRRAWAQQLRASGELVIEIDAQQSDHSGDPIITFMGALLKAKPASGRPLTDSLKDKSLKLAGIAGRAVVRAALRHGADEVLDAVSGWVKDQAPDIDALDKAVEEIEANLSNAAAQMIATHLAAETARVEELPAQIDKLRDALTEGTESNRIIVMVDELDRCHPEYAIALLEAMKLVFGRKGFVFCLMVNPHYLENIAAHRFGTKDAEEMYLEKFVDLRLTLKATPESRANATAELVSRIKVAVPFGASEYFSAETAADLAGKIVLREQFSFRQIKRAVERIDLVVRCYRDRPIDLPLLVLLAFSDVRSNSQAYDVNRALLSRSELTPERADSLMDTNPRSMSELSVKRAVQFERTVQHRCEQFVLDHCSELTGLDADRYNLAPLTHGRDYADWYKVLAGLGPNYINNHRAMLDGVMAIMG